MKLSPELQQLRLEELKKMFDEASHHGEFSDAIRSRAIFKAIDFCGEQELAMPKWVWWGFGNKLSSWYGMTAGSLDEAFGFKPVPPTTLKNKRRNSELQIEIVNRVWTLEAMQKTIPWDELAKELGKSKTSLQTFYYNWKKSFPEI